MSPYKKGIEDQLFINFSNDKFIIVIYHGSSNIYIGTRLSISSSMPSPMKGPYSFHDIESYSAVTKFLPECALHFIRRYIRVMPMK